MSTGTVTARDGLNVRKGPGTGYSKLGALTYRSSVNVTGNKQNGWYPVTFKGRSGYVCGSYLSISGGQTQQAASGGGGQYTVTATALNVRSGAGTQNRILGQVRNGQSLTAVGESNGWLKIKFGGGHGWVSKKYTKQGGGGGSQSGSTGGTSQRTVTCNTLNVRSGSSTNHRILGQVHNGQSLTVVGESNGWLKISYGSGYGWVSKKYTKAGGGGGSQQSGSSTKAQSGRVTCNTLNVRSGAGTGNGIIGKLHNGNSFSYVGESNGWLKINFNGGIGWISKKYTTVGGGTVSGGGGGQASKSQRSLGQAALNTAINLYTRAVNEGWRYDQNRRMRDGFYDCSAYSDRSWRGAGIRMGTNSEGQARMCYNAGGQVSPSQMIAGDLLFYKHNWNSGARWRGINHVAVYDGSGGRYDAGGTPIKHKSSWNDGTFVMAVRPSVLA